MKKTIIAAGVFVLFFMVSPQAFAAHSGAWGQGQTDNNSYGQQGRYWQQHPYTQRYQGSQQGYYPQGQCAARLWWYGSVSFSGECSRTGNSYQEQGGGYPERYTNNGYNDRTYYGGYGNSGSYRPTYGYSGYDDYGYTGNNYSRPYNSTYASYGYGNGSGYGAYNQGYIQPGSMWVDSSGHSRIQHGW